MVRPQPSPFAARAEDVYEDWYAWGQLVRFLMHCEYDRLLHLHYPGFFHGHHELPDHGPLISVGGNGR